MSPLTFKLKWHNLSAWCCLCLGLSSLSCVLSWVQFLTNICLRKVLNYCCAELYFFFFFRFWLPVQWKQTSFTVQRLPLFRYLNFRSVCDLNSSLCFKTTPLTLLEYFFWHFTAFLGPDYFSLKSGSRPSSPGPSPTPSVAGSVTSSSGSARHRRPLISPARLNISGQRLRLFSTEPEPTLMSPPVSPSHFLVEQSSSIYSGCFSHDISPFQSQNGAYSYSYTVKSKMFMLGGCNKMHCCVIYNTTTRWHSKTFSSPTVMERKDFTCINNFMFRCFHLCLNDLLVSSVCRFEFFVKRRHSDWRGWEAGQLLRVLSMPGWYNYTGAGEHPSSER